MITAEQLTDIGRFGQPHGIKGEINATVDRGIDIAAFRCIICDIDGIFVPFFVEGVRPRSATSLLLTIHGIADESEAALLQNKIIYALSDELSEEALESDIDEGFYAEDLIGFTVSDSSGALTGTIEGIDDSTDNVLFVVRAGSSSQTVLIPVAEELIDEIDADNRHIRFDLPEGFLEI